MASKSEGGKRGAGPASVVLIVVLAVPLLVFSPLVLSMVEHYLFGSSHVQEFFRSIGLHDELTVIYEPVLHILEFLGLPP